MSRARKPRPLLLASSGLAAIVFGANIACSGSSECPCGLSGGTGVAITTGGVSSGSTGTGVQYCGIPDGGTPIPCYPDGGAIPDGGSTSGTGGTT